MAEDDTAATTPPQTAEHHDSTIAHPPGKQEEADASPTRPESGEETAVRPEPTEEDPQQQIGEEEEPPAAEEDDAATTRPEPNADGSDPVEEDRAPIEIASEEEDAAAVQLEGEKAKLDQPEPIRLEIPAGRVKKIMKMDTDINKINSEALHLVSCSAQLFLQFLAEGSGEAAMEKKRKIVKLEHILTAAKRHRATRDFLVDELPAPSQPSDQKSADRSRARAVADKPAPSGTRRIDDFFIVELVHEQQEQSFAEECQRDGCHMGDNGPENVDTTEAVSSLTGETRPVSEGPERAFCLEALQCYNRQLHFRLKFA